MRVSGIFLVVALMLAMPPASSSAQEVIMERPNFVVFVTDDMRADDLENMPRLRERLSDAGTNFDSAFSTTPVCCPARTSILRGQYAHNHGVRTVVPPRGGEEEFKERRLERSTLATWLQNDGYRTGLVGKYLNGYTGKGVPRGWNSWDAWAGNYSGVMRHDRRLVSYGRPAETTADGTHHSDVVAREAAKFVRASDGRPFFLYVGDLAPHDPNVPAARHEGTAPDGISPPSQGTPSYFEEDNSDKPFYVRDRKPPKRGEMAEEHRERTESLYSVEDSLERLDAELRAAGELENTHVLFTSDNGYLLGEHRLQGKGAPYEESIRVPLIVRGPGVAAGKTRDELVSLNDIAPTVADLAGVRTPGFVDGRSFAPLLLGDPLEEPWRDALLIEQWRQPNRSGAFVPTFQGVRTANHTYVEYSTGTKELYDLEADPYQLENRLQEPSPETETEAEGLSIRLKDLRECAGQGCRDAEETVP